MKNTALETLTILLASYGHVMSPIHVKMANETISDLSGEKPKRSAYEVLNETIAEGRKKIKDEGTCVLGMYLKHKGKKIVDQYWQGSSSNERLFAMVKDALVKECGLNEADFSIEWGRMD